MSNEKDWLDELYAEGADDLPPAALDEKIRATARQPVAHPWYRSPARLGVLATAASLVIAASVIYFDAAPVDLETPTRESTQATFDDGAASPKREIDAPREGQALPGAAKARAPTAAPSGRQASGAAPPNQPLQRQLATPAADTPQATDQTYQTPAVTEPTERLMEEQVDEQRSESTAVGAERLATRADAVALQSNQGVDPAEMLAQRCGALPGSTETREIVADESGYLVVVTLGGDVRRWRCVDGAWLELTSEQ